MERNSLSESIKKFEANESKQTVNLGGKVYQLNVQNALKALIQYEFDNPDMGNFDDYKDDAERMRKLTKGMKELDVETIKDQIEMYFGDDEMTLKELLKNKSITA